MNNPLFRIVLFLCVVLMGTMQIVAQTDDGLDREEIDVVTSYRPILDRGDKFQLLPSGPPADTGAIAPLNYTLSPYLVEVPYEAVKVRPLSIGREKLKPLDRVYAKTGFGTQFTPLLEAHYSSGRSDKGNYGVNMDYTSSNGSLENQISAHAGAGIFGKLFAGPVSLDGNININSDIHHFYGYNQADTSFAKSDVRQRFFTWDMEFGASPIRDNDAGIAYDVNLGFGKTSDVFGNSESRPRIDFSLSKLFNETDRAYFNFWLENDAFTGSWERSRTAMGFPLGYRFVREDWNLGIGLEPSTDTGKFYLLPDLSFNRKLIDDKLVFYNGWRIALKVNSWGSLTSANPYLADSVGFRNSRVEDRYFGLKGALNKQISYNARFSQKLVSDMPFYVNDSTDEKRFVIRYDNSTILVLHAEVAFQLAQRLGLYVIADYNNYTKLDREALPWHKPTFTTRIGGNYKVDDKLNVSAEIIGISGTWALQYSPTDATTQKKLSGTADINLSATYTWSDYFDIFLDIHNMAGLRYERWNNYPSYGFQILGGLAFSF